MDALDMLGVVKALIRFKSGLPPGAGSGSGEAVRSAAREIFPVLLDMRRLILERARAAPPANAHRACLHRHPTQRVPWPPPAFAVLHSSLQPSDSMTRPIHEGVGSPLSPLLDFGAFDHDAFGSMDAAVASSNTQTSSNQKVDFTCDPFSDPWYTSVDSTASLQTSEWNLDWFNEGVPSSTPSNGSIAGSLEADTPPKPPLSYEDPFTPHPTFNEKLSASKSTTEVMHASSHTPNKKLPATNPPLTADDYDSSHEPNEKQRVSEPTPTEEVNASSHTLNEESSASEPTRAQNTNASSHMQIEEPSASELTPTGNAHASSQELNEKLSVSEPAPTEKVKFSSYASNEMPSALEPTPTDEVNASSHVPNSEVSYLQQASVKDPFASLNSVNGGPANGTYTTSWDSFASSSLCDRDSFISPSEDYCTLPSADHVDPFAPLTPPPIEQKDPFAPPPPSADHVDPFAPPPPIEQKDPFAPPPLPVNQRDPFAASPPLLPVNQRDPFAPTPPFPPSKHRDPFAPSPVATSSTSPSGASMPTASKSNAMWNLLRNDPLGAPDSRKKNTYKP